MAHTTYVSTDYDASVDCDMVHIVHRSDFDHTYTFRRDMDIAPQCDMVVDDLHEYYPDIDHDVVRRIVDHVHGALTFARRDA